MPDLAAGMGIFVVLLATKMATKFVGVYPVTKLYVAGKCDATYTTLLGHRGHGALDRWQLGSVSQCMPAAATTSRLEKAAALPHLPLIRRNDPCESTN